MGAMGEEECGECCQDSHYCIGQIGLFLICALHPGSRVVFLPGLVNQQVGQSQC